MSAKRKPSPQPPEESARPIPTKTEILAPFLDLGNLLTRRIERYVALVSQPERTTRLHNTRANRQEFASTGAVAVELYQTFQRAYGCATVREAVHLPGLGRPENYKLLGLWTAVEGLAKWFREASTDEGDTPLPALPDRLFNPFMASLADIRQIAEPPGLEEAYLLDGNRLQVGDQTILLTDSEHSVLLELVQLRVADKATLEAMTHRSDPVRVLRDLLKKHPFLKAYITLPGGKGKGGYHTTIRLGD